MATHLEGIEDKKVRPLSEADVNLLNSYLAGKPLHAAHAPGQSTAAKVFRGSGAEGGARFGKAPAPARRAVLAAAVTAMLFWLPPKFPLLPAGPYASHISQLEEDIKALDKKVGGSQCTEHRRGWCLQLA